MSKKRDIARGLSASDCVEALRAKFKAPEFALFEQVANGTGVRASRWADAVAMSIWPSRGLEIHGFEIKVDNHDWKRELANPAKAEEVQKYCDRWHIVAPRGLIQTAELPVTWGLLEVSEDRAIKVAVAAPQLSPEPLTRSFVAAILRRHHEIWAAELRAAKHEGREEGAKNGHGTLADRLAAADRRLQELQESVTTYEKASGLRIAWGWDLGNVGAAVRTLVDESHRTTLKEHLEREVEFCAKRIETARKEIAQLEKIRTPKKEVA